MTYIINYNKERLTNLTIHVKDHKEKDEYNINIFLDDGQTIEDGLKEIGINTNNISWTVRDDEPNAIVECRRISSSLPMEVQMKYFYQTKTYHK